MCTHTHTHNAPHPFLLQTARGLSGFLSCFLVGGAGACVFCPELHLMVSVCPADGLRFCAEHSVRLVAIPRGESAPALCLLVRGGRAWSGPSTAAAVGVPPRPLLCGAHSSGPSRPPDHGRTRALCLQMSSSSRLLALIFIGVLRVFHCHCCVIF